MMDEGEYDADDCVGDDNELNEDDDVEAEDEREDELVDVEDEAEDGGDADD